LAARSAAEWSQTILQDGCFQSEFSQSSVQHIADFKL
jgi:hypothetical protein